MIPLPYSKENWDAPGLSLQAESLIQSINAPLPLEPATIADFKTPAVLWRAMKERTKATPEITPNTNQAPRTMKSTPAINPLAADSVEVPSFELSDTYLYCWASPNNLIDHEPYGEEPNDNDWLRKLVSVPLMDSKPPIMTLFMWVSDERNSGDSLSFSNTDDEAELLRDDNGPESRLLPHLTSSADQEYLRRSERTLKAILVEINQALQQERPRWLEKEYPKRDISISTRRKTLADLVEGLAAAKEHHNGERMGRRCVLRCRID